MLVARTVGVALNARVLVADDDAEFLDVVAEGLTRLGADVIRARNGAELIDHLAEHGPFDLVVTDIAMPWMTGLRAMHAARTAGLDTSVIVITGLREEGIPARVKALGGNAVPAGKTVHPRRPRVRCLETPRATQAPADRPSRARVGRSVFPPALVPILRDRMIAKAGSLVDVADDVLVQLLTTIFWAGLETYEGERNPIGVVFLGTSDVDVVTADAADADAPFLYQWRVQHFESPRPFAIGELVKLAVAGPAHLFRRQRAAGRLPGDHRTGSRRLQRLARSVRQDHRIASGLSQHPPRSGSAARVRAGRHLTGGEDVVFAAGPVRRALEDTAHAADLDDDAVPDYVDAVRAIVWEMAAHGRGGILIVSTEEWLDVAEAATYRMAGDSSVASLLRLARHLGRAKGGDRPPQAATAQVAYGSLLRNAFLTEAERLTEELGALTGSTARFCSTATSPSSRSA
jgi:CheY-like chemotaxis protein